MNNNISLFNVGPTKLHSSVMSGMTKPFNGCTSKESINVVRNVGIRINRLLNDNDRYSFAIPGSGSTAMEVCVNNFAHPGDEVLVCSSGVFGDRMIEMFRRRQAKVTTIHSDRTGGGIGFSSVEKLLQTKKFSLIALVHLETSTGVLQPLKEIFDLAQKYKALLMVDMVSSLGGMKIDLSKIDIDIIYSSSQKCLSAGTGLGIISINQTAYQYIQNSSNPVPWCWDIELIVGYIKRGLYPFTTPIIQLNALNEALKYIESVGYDAYFSIQQECGAFIKKEMLNIGFSLLTEPEYESPFLKVFLSQKTSSSMDMLQFKDILLQDYNIAVAGGLGKYKHTTIRIGTMGTSANQENIKKLIDSIREILNRTEL